MSATRITITYFNVSLIGYSSFFLEALQLAARSKPGRSIKIIIKQATATEVGVKPNSAICFFRAECGAQCFSFLIDADDTPSVRLVLPRNGCFRTSDLRPLYFKVNLRGAPGSDQTAKTTDPKILAVPPFFALRPSHPWRLVNMRAGWRRISDDVTDLVTLPPLSQILGLRSCMKTHDVAFLSAYYPHPDHKLDNEYRLELIERLRRENSIRCIAYFAVKERANLPEHFRHVSGPYLPLKRFLRLLAASRLGVYVRGVHDCYSFKLPQYMALGLPIVGQPILRDGFEDMGPPSYSDQFSFESPGELVNRMKDLLSQPAELQALGVGNMNFFDEALNPMAVGKQILQEVANHFESGSTLD